MLFEGIDGVYMLIIKPPSFVRFKMPHRRLTDLNTAIYFSCSSVDRGVPPPVIRVLINFCSGNFVRFAWCSIVPDYFLAINGVKQGGVLSPVLFCFCINGFLVALAKAGVGCFVGDYFVEALIYADDIVLLMSMIFKRLYKGFNFLCWQ